MGLMVVCAVDPSKIYVRPTENRYEADLKLKEHIENEFGLPLSSWVVFWYRLDDPNMIMELVKPENEVADIQAFATFVTNI